VAVQVAPGLNPLIVVTNGVASLAEPELGLAEPLVQLTLTDTLAPSFGTKSLFTVRVALFWVLVIVQDALPPLLIATLTQAAWFAT
jgi:hypothetical protein